MFSIGLSTCGRPITPALFESYRAAGIEMMEVSFGNYNHYRTLNFSDLERYAAASGVKLWSFHLSFAPFEIIDISSNDKQVFRYSIDILSEQIKRAGEIGINKYIIHPSAEPIGDSEREQRILCAMEGLEKLAQTADRAGGVLCVEDLPRDCLGNTPEEINRLISTDSRLRVCFDTNHLLKSDPVDFVKKVGERIVTLHVSDYDFINERHWLPGEGKLDIHAIYRALLDIGYDGPWLYELGFENTETITREHPLTAFDFVKNAKEIFDGHPLSVIPHKIHI